MKKVLFIAYHYPPRPGIGSQRPYKLSKFFPKFGWEPVVLTAQLPGSPPEGTRVLQTGYADTVKMFKSLIRFNHADALHEKLGIRIEKNSDQETWKSKLTKHVYQLFTFPDPQIGWYKHALKSASNLFEKEKFDVILSTSYPVTSHLIAKKLKLKYNLPWVADFRDPWSQNPHYGKLECVRSIEREIELRTLSSADLIVTVTQPWVKLLRELHKNKEVLCITNGFDDDDFPKHTIPLTEKFTITYTGQLYNGKRDPVILFKVLNQLIKEKRIQKECVEIRLFCPNDEWLLDEVREYALQDVVNIYGFVPRQEVLCKQKESQILLLLLWEKEDEEGLCQAKLYEYLGAGRPIVAIAGERGVTKDILEKTGAGRVASNPEVLRKTLLELYDDFNRSRAVKVCGNEGVEEYRYPNIARRYCEALDRLIGV